MTRKATETMEKTAERIRRRCLDLALAAGSAGAHLGAALSIAEILAVLYGGVLRYDPKRPQWPERDRFILSKGHAGLGLYAALAEAGLISEEELATFQKPGSDFTTHPTMNRPHGSEFSTGSLGMGLGLGVGLALALKKKNLPTRVFVLLGDGECDEGSVWEAMTAAAHFKLDHLTAIIDRNRLQQSGPVSEQMETGDLRRKGEAFGWDAVDVDGHNVAALVEAFCKEPILGLPRLVVAQTVKGKGFAFCENNPAWHHGVLTQAQYDAALNEGKGTVS